MSYQIESWLNSKVNDQDVEKYKVNEYTIKPYYSQYDMSNYYKPNDTDIKANSLNYDEKLSEYDDHIFLYPNTNRYHANMLFRQLTDYAYNRNFDYCDRKHNVMDISMKKSFYKFCHENSI